jgi:hypothetical protein
LIELKSYISWKTSSDEVTPEAKSPPEVVSQSQPEAFLVRTRVDTQDSDDDETAEFVRRTFSSQNDYHLFGKIQKGIRNLVQDRYPMIMTFVLLYYFSFPNMGEYS